MKTYWGNSFYLREGSFDEFLSSNYSNLYIRLIYLNAKDSRNEACAEASSLLSSPLVLHRGKQYPINNGWSEKSETRRILKATPCVLDTMSCSSASKAALPFDKFHRRGRTWLLILLLIFLHLSSTLELSFSSSYEITLCIVYALRRGRICRSYPFHYTRLRTSFKEVKMKMKRCRRVAGCRLNK